MRPHLLCCPFEKLQVVCLGLQLFAFLHAMDVLRGGTRLESPRRTEGQRLSSFCLLGPGIGSFAA